MKNKHSLIMLVGIPVLVFLLVFGILFRLIMGEYFTQRNILDHGASTLGTVTNRSTYLVWDSGSSSSELRYRLSYTFTAPGWTSLAYHYDSGTDTGLEVGDKIEIAFDPANPANNFPVKYAAKISNYHLIVGVPLALFAGGAACGLVFILMEPLWKKRRSSRT